MTVLTQEGRKITYSRTDNHCGGDYVTKSLEPLNNGMVLVMSYWGNAGSGSDMAWLDEPPCDNRECGGGSVTFSNFQISNSQMENEEVSFFANE